MKLLITLCLAMVTMAEQQVKIFDIKYGDTRRICEMLRAFNPPDLRWDDVARTISVRAEPESLKAMEEIIKRYDVVSPYQNLEFTIYMIFASPDPGKSGPIPPALDPVIKQMSQAFAFKSFKLNDTMMLRCREGKGAEVSSIAPTPGIDGNQMFYQAKFQSARVIPDEKGKNIRIDSLRIGLRVPYRGGDKGYQYADIGFSTDIDVREGQKAVVGKANLQGPETMFAVLVPKILD